MLANWFRGRRALVTDLDNIRAWRNQLGIELEDLADENEALTRQLDAARLEIAAVKTAHGECETLRRDLANARTELAALKADPLYEQLQKANRHAMALARRLDEMQQSSLALDRPFS